MKRSIWLMLLFLSITAPLCAQENRNTPEKNNLNGADKTFELDPDKINRRFWIDLGRNNRLRIELQNIDDLERLHNIDSLLMVFINDMQPFKDSLADLLAIHRIDYVSDPTGRKKIRIRTDHPASNSYLLDQGEPSALKLEQDTINILILTAAPANHPRWDKRTMYYDRVTLIVNQYHDIVNYVTGGLNEKISWLQANMYGIWNIDKGGSKMKKDPTITAAYPIGMIGSGPGKDYLISAAHVDIGNYKNFFVPSFGVGFAIHFNSVQAKNSIAIIWEPNFIFDHNAQGHLQTYRNDFLVLGFMQDKKDGFVHQLVTLSPTASLGYLIRRRGDYFDKNTFRLGIGGLRFYDGGLKIEPCLFFHDLFKETTPGLRATLAF